MSDEPDPPRKFYGFKPTTFEVANPGVVPAPDVTPTAATPPPDPGIVRVDDHRIDVRELNRLAATGLPPLNTPPVTVPENEVHTILRENLAVANSAGLNDVKLDPNYVSQQQRRVRRFWLVIFAFDVPLGAFAWWIGHEQAIPFACAVGGIGFVTGRLIWETFFLNTD
jgi:hypothetical protein